MEAIALQELETKLATDTANAVKQTALLIGKDKAKLWIDALVTGLVEFDDSAAQPTVVEVVDSWATVDSGIAAVVNNPVYIKWAAFGQTICDDLKGGTGSLWAWLQGIGQLFKIHKAA